LQDALLQSDTLIVCAMLACGVQVDFRVSAEQKPALREKFDKLFTVGGINCLLQTLQDTAAVQLQIYNPYNP
jgi:hypothetical protein